MSEGFAQGPYVVARVEFEPDTFRTKGIELTTEPPRSNSLHCSHLQKHHTYSRKCLSIPVI